MDNGEDLFNLRMSQSPLSDYQIEEDSDLHRLLMDIDLGSTATQLSGTGSSIIRNVPLPAPGFEIITIHDMAQQHVEVQPRSADTRERFIRKTEPELAEIEKFNQAAATKRNTQWGVKALKEWNADMGHDEIDFETVTKVDLNTKLRHFYVEARPQKSTDANDEYHKNTLKNMRSAINRHLNDLHRDIDLVNDKEFRESNKLLNSKLKLMVHEGKSRPVKHKSVINSADLERIHVYLSLKDPIALRLRVWYLFSVHFVSRALEMHHQLRMNSIAFEKDENGREFVTLKNETVEKTNQGGIDAQHEGNQDKRMYATDTEDCPVAALKDFMARTSKDAEMLFNKISRDALKNPIQNEIWYIDQPLEKRTFSNFMPDISKSAKCSQRYTGHCLRATAIQHLNDSGFATRQIMFMSGHRNEASIRSYNRSFPAKQKQAISDSLSDLTNVGNRLAPRHVNHCASSTATASQSVARIVPVPASITFTPSTVATTIPVSTVDSRIVSSQALNVDTHCTSNVLKSMGFLNNCTFQNCSFSFSPGLQPGSQSEQ